MDLGKWILSVCDFSTLPPSGLCLWAKFLSHYIYKFDSRHLPIKAYLFNFDSVTHLTHVSWGSVRHSLFGSYRLVYFFTYFLAIGEKKEIMPSSVTSLQGFSFNLYLFFLLHHLYVPDPYFSLVSINWSHNLTLNQSTEYQLFSSSYSHTLFFPIFFSVLLLLTDLCLWMLVIIGALSLLNICSLTSA